MRQRKTKSASVASIAARVAGQKASQQRRILAAVAAFTAGGVVALAPTPASASVSQGYVAGSGVITDDWGDEGPLSSSQKSNTYAVGLWQWVLYAEQVKESNGTTFDEADIDCRFGANTTYATKQLQKKWGLDQDGVVGPKTFGRADNNLWVGSIDPEYVGYSGAGITLTFLRDASNGHYAFPIVFKDNWYTEASYNYAPIEACQYG